MTAKTALNAPGAVTELAAGRAAVLAAYHRHLSLGLARLAELMHAGVEARSQGVHVWDEDGERYLDCGGYGVFTLGHCHPHVVEAVVRQVQTHPATTYFLLSRIRAEAAETLARVAPAGLDFVHFGQSGADAVEGALKLARLNGRRRVVAMSGGYHGLSFGALSVTEHEAHRRALAPLLDDVAFVPFGDAAALAEALRAGPPACVIVEPVQAEAGVVVPPDGYLRAVERACRSHGALLAVDEIQTGLGRLGAWWGVGQESVTPDILLVGKALSGGVIPVSAVVATEAVFRPFSRDPALHTSTFSGAPIAAAAAKAAVEAIEAEDIVGRAARLGEKLRTIVTRAIAETCPGLVRAVRCAGLLIAIEWEADHYALDFLIEMLDRRVILALSSNAPRVTRLTPPAIMADEHIAELEAALRASATALARR